MEEKIRIYFSDEGMEKDFRGLGNKFQTDEFLRFIDFNGYFETTESPESVDIIISKVEASESSVMNLLQDYYPPSENHFVYVQPSKDWNSDFSGLLSGKGFKICYDWREITQRLIMFLKERGEVRFDVGTPSLLDKIKCFKKQTIYFSPDLPELQQMFLTAEEKDMGRHCDYLGSYYVFIQLKKYFDVVEAPQDADVKVWSERHPLLAKSQHQWNEYIVVRNPQDNNMHVCGYNLINADLSKGFQRFLALLYNYLYLGKGILDSAYSNSPYFWRQLNY